MKLQQKYVLLLLGIILCVGMSLRYHNYQTWPREGATFDEFAWTFLGISLWQDGRPTSWSPHGAYEKRQEYYNPKETHFTLVTPYLEHPPLFGLLAGGFARLRGVRSFDQVTIQKIRPLALALGAASMIAVFLLAQAVYGNSIALLATGIYAITPTVVIGSRLVQNENFFIPLFILSLFLAYSHITRPNRVFLYALFLLCALLPLAKVPWIASPIAVTAMFIYTKKWKEAVAVAYVTVLAFSLFLLWGFQLDGNVFLNLWKLQLARYDMAFDSMFKLFTDPLIADRSFVDGWIYFGWAASLFLISNYKKQYPIVFGLLAYALIYTMAIPSESLHGWYRYPFYPFLAISTAVFIKEQGIHNAISMAVFYLLTGLSMIQQSWGVQYGFSYTIHRVYILAILSSTLPVFFPRLAPEKIRLYAQCILILLVICVTCVATISYTEQ